MDFELERKKLVESLVRRGYISKPEVIRAMMKVPRHIFVPWDIQSSAYYDCPQSIGEGQTISAPHMVGIMLEKLDLAPGHTVLEVGGGSGYHAAVVAEVVGKEGHVYSVEYIEKLAKKARMNIEACGLSDIVTIIEGDGSQGLVEHAPYDRIFVTCASPDVPPPLLWQLKDKGKLLIPAGSRHYQTLVSCEKKGDNIVKKDLGGCVFVPLRGKYGFKKR
ncbi:MAG: protein-L-isoaspartate O-methyltransferase [Thermoplasmata archaeon]|nr:MAG: protein-L-isoaspartate O-methyltransferase [Thermoplasmata archaeon]